VKVATISTREDLLSLTLDGCRVAASAASAAAEAIAHGSAASFRMVRAMEQRLDALDRELDQRAAGALIQTDITGARELLSCCKIMVDLERTGDLLTNFINRTESVRTRIDMQDAESLIKMSCVLEKMLVDSLRAFSNRDVSCALRVLRADSEIDRLRNLLVLRHTEFEAGTRRESAQVVMMAQALERAGDHAKNLAEEVCHLVTGQTVRHLMRANDKPYEQMFIEWLKGQHAAASPITSPIGTPDVERQASGKAVAD
jgi:phosphate transport system protein